MREVIWQNSSTLWLVARSLGRIRSRSSNLPEARYRSRLGHTEEREAEFFPLLLLCLCILPSNISFYHQPICWATSAMELLWCSSHGSLGRFSKVFFLFTCTLQCALWYVTNTPPKDCILKGKGCSETVLNCLPGESGYHYNLLTKGSR